MCVYCTYRRTRVSFQIGKENFRVYIKVRTAFHIQLTIMHDELCTVFGDEAPSYTTIAKWSKNFPEGRAEINDDIRSGKPITATTSENIEEIQSMISI